MLSRHNVFGFEPSFVLAIVAGAIHTLLAIVITALNLRYKTRYMMVVSIAATADLIGYFIRANSAKHPDVLGSRIAMELFVLLSPLVLALGSYLTVAKLIRSSDA
ncbi:hypothetical protein K7432_008253 [Basidiobolus ranarum]|uniref:Uncharacterized protein n=1 Tax=Basidiobolus ranarum TaxID=34480 RepID=A0ABR2VZD3_9FUNG